VAAHVLADDMVIMSIDRTTCTTTTTTLVFSGNNSHSRMCVYTVTTTRPSLRSNYQWIVRFGDTLVPSHKHWDDLLSCYRGRYRIEYGRGFI